MSQSNRLGVQETLFESCSRLHSNVNHYRLICDCFIDLDKCNRLSDTSDPSVLFDGLCRLEFLLQRKIDGLNVTQLNNEASDRIHQLAEDSWMSLQRCTKNWLANSTSLKSIFETIASRQQSGESGVKIDGPIKYGRYLISVAQQLEKIRSEISMKSNRFENQLFSMIFNALIDPFLINRIGNHFKDCKSQVCLID